MSSSCSLGARLTKHRSRTSDLWLAVKVDRKHADILDSVSVLARGSMILADTVVIVATWITMRQQVQGSFDLKMKSSTSAVMLADGASIFVVLGIATIDMNFDRNRVLCVSVVLAGCHRLSDS